MVDEPASGAWNMAVDEALLESASITRQPVLRFYSWAEPTLSLGYFQRLEDRCHHEASLNCPVVRRASGGGAIVHDRELTYSFCVPVKDRLSNDVFALYRSFHETLVQILDSCHVSASLREAAGASSRQAVFLCFQRHTNGDVLVDNRKIAGSAQRRHRGAILQHGSILLATSPSAPELPGIKELSGSALEITKVATNWGQKLAHKLEIEFRKTPLTSHEEQLVDQSLHRKFGNKQWTKRR